jgi:NAD+ synthase (glutamine-hydrolysing)
MSTTSPRSSTRARLGLVPKEKLPLYNVFYEARTLARGAPGLPTLDGVPSATSSSSSTSAPIALEVCEDGWSPDGPMRRRSLRGAELVVNLSRRPFASASRDAARDDRDAAGDCQATVAYVNLVGANDGLVFDGGGFVARTAASLFEAPRFREGFAAVTVDLDRTRRLRTENTTWREDQEAFAAAATLAQPSRVGVPEPTGAASPRRIPSPQPELLPPPRGPPAPAPARRVLRGAARRARPRRRRLLREERLLQDDRRRALRGPRQPARARIARRWIDLRWPALPAASVRPRPRASSCAPSSCPRAISSTETRLAAEQTARDSTPRFAVVVHRRRLRARARRVEKMLQPGEAVTRMARQNVQARVRAERMWTWANAAAGLFLQTSNMSEKAVGYVTIGGDGEGALSVIANVPKTVVNYLIDWLYETTARRASASRS